MAETICQVCGKGINTSKSNCICKDGVFTHKKCPPASNKPVLSDDNKKDYRDLTDAIDWLTQKQLGHKLAPGNWALITKQIKKLSEAGYSYQDQIYAFKWYFDEKKGNEYKGFGIVSYIIEESLAERAKQEEVEKIKESAQGNDEKIKEFMERKRKERSEGV